MSETKIDPNLWQAFLSEPYGFCYTNPAEIAAELADPETEIAEISIRRGSALPTDRDGGLRLPGTHYAGDVFMDIRLDDIEPEDWAATWELAQKAAWGMNQQLPAAAPSVSAEQEPEGSDA